MTRDDEKAGSAALLGQEIDRLRDRLREAEDELRAIREGEIDAIVLRDGNDEVLTLERPEQPLRLLVGQIAEAAATLTVEGRILCANERFATLVREPAASLVDVDIRELVAPECHATLDAMLAKATSADAEATLILRGGDAAVPVPFCLHAIGTSAFGTCLMLTDRSESKRFEELERAQVALRRSEEALRLADKRKDEFLATLAHELRNPLAPMRNAVEFLRAKGSSGPELRWAHDVMDRQVHLMTRLLDDLLDVSRVALDKPELRRTVVELAAVVDAAVETSFPLVERAKQELTVSLPEVPIYVEADPVRLSQVFANLLNNAAKYTDEGGSIRLVAEKRDHEVVVSVSDTGIGIAPEQLSHVFDIFSQAKPALGRSQGGLGIGLSLVRGLVELHGGTVEARSEGVGRGSTFTVRLPTVDGTGAAADVATEQAAPKPRAHRRVLVVDDHRDSADSLAMLLKTMGHEVERAYDGEQAVALACELRPELVLLDIGMPRVDGYEACRRIKSQPWSDAICVVALTGWGQEQDRRKSQAAGFDHHLVKPVDLAELSALIARLDPMGRLHPEAPRAGRRSGGQADRRFEQRGEKSRDGEARAAAPREGNLRESFPGDVRNRPGRRSSDTTPAP